MVAYQRKELDDNGVHFVVDAEAFEEDGRLYVMLTPRQDMALDVGHPCGSPVLLQMGKQPWPLELETFTERYEPVQERKSLKLG